MKSLVKENLGGNPVEEITSIDAGESHAIYAIRDHTGKEYVVRVFPWESNKNCHFKEEIWAYDACRSVGVPTPTVVSSNMDPKDFPRPFMIMDRIMGIMGDDASITETDKHTIIQELGYYMGLIHSIELKGFGKIRKVGDEFRGEFDTYWDFIMYELSHTKEYIIANNLDSTEIERVISLFIQNKSLLDTSKAHLIHGDIQLKNTIVRGSKIVGLLDMVNLMAGSPLLDFQSFYYWFGDGKEYFSDLQKRYSNKAILANNFMEKIYLYNVWYAQQMLIYQHGRGNPDGVKRTEDKIKKLNAKIS